MKTVDFVARCLISSVENQIGNISIKKITKEEYDSIIPDENTIYYVVDGDKIIQYIGGVKIGTGSISGLSSLYGNAYNSIKGDAGFSEIS